jgi:hypothetical protein
MKKAKVFIVIAVVITIIVVVIVLLKKSSEKKRTRAFKDMYTDGKIYVYDSPVDNGERKYTYYENSQQAVILADKNDISKTSGMVRVVAVKTNENGKLYTRRVNGYIYADMLV